VTPARIASAPGKVVLCGEYAVLDGAPAVCMAVDRRARVSVGPAAGRDCAVRAPGFPGRSGRFRVEAGMPRWIDGRQDFGVVDAVLAAGARAPSACEIELDTRAFIDEETGTKTGIGSSAALVVALAAALEASEAVFELALAAHRKLQGGAGSGVDVAAAVRGGLVEYRMRGSQAGALAFPDGLAFRVVFSGVAASTARKLAALDARDRAPSREALSRAANEMAGAWRSGAAATVLDAYPAYVDALRRFDVDHRLGIFDAGHGRLTDTARREGLVYKPAGAGGGDVGILFGRDFDSVDEFLASYIVEPQRVLPCRLDPRGVMLEQL